MTPLLWLEFLKSRRLEQSLHTFPFEFSVCSEIDRKVLGADSRVWVTPNSVDLPTQEPDPNQEHVEPILVFVGTLTYPPNIDLVMFFVRRVLPLTRRQVPDVRFFIVGRDPVRSVQQLHDGKSVTVAGTVAEVG